MVRRANALVFLLALSILKKFFLFQNTNQIIFLIGENKGEPIKDNGYYFYKYCNEVVKNKNFYFVVSSKSAYFDTLSQNDPKIVRYGSIRHLFLFFNASICLYTHTYRDVLYRESFELFGKNKKLVFLHHGVLGFKKFDSFYRDKKNIMDFFTIGNSVEEDILINIEKVDKKRVKRTGYARYDYMEDRANSENKQIVYMPTFRNWLLPAYRSFVSGDLRNSEFGQKISSLLNNTELSTVLENNNVKFKFFFHKEFQGYKLDLNPQTANIENISFKEYTAGDLISKSHMMITDYSSVAWDFFYLGKPVVFYRFDMDHYLKSRSSYIPLDQEIIGDVVLEEATLINKIKLMIESDFIVQEKYQTKRDEIMPAFDKNNCHRIYLLVLSLVA